LHSSIVICRKFHDIIKFSKTLITKLQEFNHFITSLKFFTPLYFLVQFIRHSKYIAW
jgi:hypothetical protein